MSEMISPASRSRIRVSQVVETTRGTTPTNPAWKVIPHLDDTNLDENQTFERSNEVKSNRMGGKQVGGNVMAEGPISVPMKNDPAIRELVESAFSCVLASPTKTGATMAFVSNGTRADGDLVFTGQVDVGDTITVNGVVFTFKATAITTREVAIGASAEGTIDNLVAKLNAHQNSDVAAATYSKVSTDQLHIVYDQFGTVGNAFTIAWNFASQTAAYDGGLAATTGSDTLADGAGSADTITNSDNDFHTLGFNVHQTVTIANATTAGNDGTYVITGISADGSSITLDRDINTAETFAAGTSITSNAFFGSAGTNRRFFTHEIAFLDLDPIVYEYYRGDEVNTFEMEVPTSGEVKGTFNMIGVSGEITEVVWPIGGGSRTDSAAVVPFAGSVEGAQLDRGSINRPEVESMSVSINNNRAAKFGIGQAHASHIEEGDWDAEITAALYFVDSTVRDQYLAGTRTSLVITLIDQQDGHRLMMEFPNIVFTEGPKGLSGQTVIQNMKAFAEESATYGTKARVWFIPA